MNATVLDLLSSVRPPETTAFLRAAAKPLDHAEFAARVAGLAECLRARAGRRWLLAVEETWPAAVGLFALMYAGKEVVLPRNYQPASLAEVGAGCEAVLDPDTVLAAPAVKTAGLPPLTGDSLIELSTSGSSGGAKAVPKRLQQLDAEVNALEAVWGQRLGHRKVIATVPWHHIYGLLFRILWPLATGRASDSTLCSTPDLLLERARANGMSALVSSPAHLSRLGGLVDLAHLRPHLGVVFSSGAPLPAAAAAELGTAWGHAPIEVYGSTETGGIGWRVQWPEADPAWQPLPGVTVEADGKGGLSVLSPFVAEDAFASIGDAGEMLADGRFRLRGRADRIVKIEGKRVALPEVERRLAEHAWIAQAAVAVLNGRRDTLGAVLVCAAEGRRALGELGHTRATRELGRYLRDWFDPVTLPRRWRFVDQLPYDERGKLSQSNLARLFGNVDA